MIVPSLSQYCTYVSFFKHMKNNHWINSHLDAACNHHGPTQQLSNRVPQGGKQLPCRPLLLDISKLRSVHPDTWDDSHTMALWNVFFFSHQSYYDMIFTLLVYSHCMIWFSPIHPSPISACTWVFHGFRDNYTGSDLAEDLVPLICLWTWSVLRPGQTSWVPWGWLVAQWRIVPIWRFPKIGVHQNHPFLLGISNYEPSFAGLSGIIRPWREKSQATRNIPSS